MSAWGRLVDGKRVAKGAISRQTRAPAASIGRNKCQPNDSCNPSVINNNPAATA